MGSKWSCRRLAHAPQCLRRCSWGLPPQLFGGYLVLLRLYTAIFDQLWPPQAAPGQHKIISEILRFGLRSFPKNLKTILLTGPRGCGGRCSRSGAKPRRAPTACKRPFSLGCVPHTDAHGMQVNTAACKRLFSLGCVPHTDGAVFQEAAAGGDG